MELEKFFNPKSIVLVGASEKTGTVGNALAKNLLELGYLGKVFLVNPNYENLLGQKSYSSLGEIEEMIDLAIVAVPAKIVTQIIKDSAEKTKNFIIISAGFSETGEEGKARERELRALADQKGINILGPNCLGFINPAEKLNASFAGGMPEKGNITFVSQSGALAVALSDKAKKTNLGFSKIISLGNKMQIDEIEMLEFLKKDPETKVIGMYLEGIGNGERFLEVASEISRSKPVVILKAGRTPKSQKAISSHTGALAGNDQIIDAVFEKAGVIRADNISQFFGLMKFLSFQGFLGNSKVAVVTNAGGPGVMATDAFLEKKVELSEIDEKIKEDLKSVLPAESSLENPIDLLGDASEERYLQVLSILDKDQKIGTIVCILTPQEQTPVEKIADEIISFSKKSPKKIVTVFIGGERIENAVSKIEKAKIPNFSFPLEAIDILSKARAVKREKIKIPEINQERKEKAIGIIKKAKGEKRGVLSFGEASQMFELYGISSSNFSYNPDKFDFDFPIVAKIDDEKILHKTDQKGVVVGIKNQEELDEVLKEFQERFPTSKVLIQPMLPGKMEMILGSKKDDIFGSIIVFGLGGIYTEIFKKIDFFVPPLSPEEIKEKLSQSSLNFLFKETRGQTPYNIEEISALIYSFSLLLFETGKEIKEIDINPLFIYNDGKKAQATDIKVIINK